MMLEQLLGLYFIIVGVVVLYRRRSLMPAIGQLVANPALRTVIGLVEIMAGLAIVLIYTEVTLDAAGLVSLIGWTLIVEGIVYLSMPSRTVQKFLKRFNRDSWYRTGGVIAVIMGAYLAGVGFGYF